MSAETGFRIESHIAGDGNDSSNAVVQVNLIGEIESENIQTIEEHFNNHVSGQKTRFLVDLKDLLFINSMGLGFLAAFSEKVKNEKGGMKIINLSENLQDLFYLTQMDKILSIYPNEARALEDFKAGK